MPCPICGNKITIDKHPRNLRYECECGAGYGCDLVEDRE